MLMRTSVNLKVNHEQMTQIMLNPSTRRGSTTRSMQQTSRMSRGAQRVLYWIFGDSVTHAVPICEEIVLLYAVLRFDLAGRM